MTFYDISWTDSSGIRLSLSLRSPYQALYRKSRIERWGTRVRVVRYELAKNLRLGA